MSAQATPGRNREGGNTQQAVMITLFDTWYFIRVFKRAPAHTTVRHSTLVGVQFWLFDNYFKERYQSTTVVSRAPARKPYVLHSTQSSCHSFLARTTPHSNVDRCKVVVAEMRHSLQATFVVRTRYVNNHEEVVHSRYSMWMNAPCRWDCPLSRRHSPTRLSALPPAFETRPRYTCNG